MGTKADDMMRKNVMVKDELLAMLVKHSYKKGTFTLASGKQSDFYIDCKRTFLQRDGIWLVSAALAEEAAKFQPVGIAGEGFGGIPLATAVSMRSGFLSSSHVHPVLVRSAKKNHGSGHRVERAENTVPDGSRVVLVEDVLTTGGSAFRAVEALRAAKLEVSAVIALVDRQEGAQELLNTASVAKVAIYTKDDFV